MAAIDSRDTFQIDCPDCDFEKTVFGRDVAQGKTWNHANLTGHAVEFEEKS